MNQRKQKFLIIGLFAAAILAVLLYCLTHHNMTGASYNDIEAYRAEHPNVTVTYKISISGGTESLTLKHNSKSAKLTDAAQIDRLAEYAAYLQNLQTIELSSLCPNGQQLDTLIKAYPNAKLVLSSVTIAGEVFPADASSVEIGPLTLAAFDDAVLALPFLTQAEQIVIHSNGDAPYTAEQAAALAAAVPNAAVTITFDLFGQTVSTDMERIEYFQTDIGGDAGLDVIRSVMPIMDKLTYLKLDWCGTSDEATAALRDELADRCKVVWRVFLTDEYNALTDTYKIWAQFELWGENVECLKYCTEVRYIDMGHSYVDNCEFVKYMPYLDTLILADSWLEDLEPLRTCENLTYLEVFSSRVKDISPLADLPQLEYLNISNCKITDISPLYGLENLVIVNCTMAKIPSDQIATFKETHPDTKCTFNWYQSPTEYCWRHGPTPEGYRRTPRYALLREQIGYDTKDYSRYPTGYVTEEITYESTGITPHTELDYEVYPK